MTFETNPRFLRDLLNEACQGSLQLPDFQRSYVWGDSDVRALLASILNGFPVGALLTLRMGGEVNFRPRLVEGVERARNKTATPVDNPAKELLLDGQQRITSLYGALKSPQPMVVRSPKSERKTLRRYYYLDIKRVLEPGEDLEEAILGLPESRIRRDELMHIDLSSREKELEAACFPLNIAFSDEAFDWIDDFRDYASQSQPDMAQAGKQFRKQLLEPLRSYQMPVITLDQQTSREAVCLVFEKVNVGGKKLDAFELVTAIFSGSQNPLNLRDDWETRRKHIRSGRDARGMNNPVFDHLRGFDFLQAVSLCGTHAARQKARKAGVRDLPQVSCKREALLRMRLTDYRDFAERVEDGFRRAGKFLNQEKVLWARDLPYPAQLVALAAIFALMGKQADSAEARARLGQWFWRTTLAQDYGASPESKLAKDAEDICAWLAGEAEPERMRLMTFNPDRLYSLRRRVSAAYRGFAALLLREGCRDFITGQSADIATFHADPMDVHHIFPRKWCMDQGIPPERYDAILNKTPLSAVSNKEIGGRAPSEYLERIEERHKLKREQLDEILESHLIKPSLLRSNDFESFLIDRKQKLTDLTARAMGLSLANLQADTDPNIEPEYDSAEDDLGIEEESA